MLFFTQGADRIDTPPAQASKNKKTNLQELCDAISSPAPAVVQAIAEIRSLTAKLYTSDGLTDQQAKDLKAATTTQKKELPYFIASGFCEQHHNDQNLQYNGILQIDIDIKSTGGDQQAQELKSRLAAFNLPYILAAFISPSGYGLKLLFATDNHDINRHHSAALQAFEHLAALLNIDIKLFDRLGASQPCYYSYDQDIYINTGQISEFKIKAPTVPPARPKEKRTIKQITSDSDTVTAAAKFLIDNKIDVAACYDDYLKISAACFSAFGTDGADIAKDILDNSSAYLESEYRRNFDQHWKSLYKGTKTTGATIVHLAKQNGFKPASAKKTTFDGIFLNIKPVKEYQIKKYVTEIQNELLNDILTFDRLQVQGATDIGKTTAIINMMTPAYFSQLQAAGIEKIIIPVPRKSLDFTGKIFDQTDIKTTFIDGTADQTDIKGAMYGSSIIVVTYDSLYKLKEILPVALVVPDEIQKLINDNSFRSDTCANFFELLSQAKKVCIISATPVLELCAGDILGDGVTQKTKNKLNYKLIKITAAKDQRKIITPVFYKGRRQAVSMQYLDTCLNSTTPGRHIVLLNDLKELETGAEIINAKYHPDAVNILSSKKPEYSTDSPFFKGKISDQTKIILCTSYADAGLDFSFDVASIGIFGRASISDRAQFLGRPRAAGSANAELQIKLFFSYQDKDADQIKAEFKSGENFKPKAKTGDLEQPEAATDTKQPPTERSAYNRLKAAIITAENAAAAWTNTGLSFTNDLKKGGEAISVIFDHETKTWQPSLIDIIAAHQRQTEQLLTTYGKIKAMTFFDSTIEILEPVFIDNTESNKEAAELLTEKRQAEKDQKAAAFELFCANIPASLEIVYHSSRDRQLRQNIAKLKKQDRKLSDQAKDLKEQHASACKYLMVPAVRYLELIKLAGIIRDLNQSDIPAILLNTSTEKKYQEFKNSIIELWRLNKKQKDSGTGLDAKDRQHAWQSERIRQELKDKTEMTAAEIKQVYKKATGQPGDLATAKKRIAELYFLIYNKKEKLYFIGVKKDLKSIIDSAKNGRMMQQHFCGGGGGKTLNNNNLQNNTGTKKLVI